MKTLRTLILLLFVLVLLTVLWALAVIEEIFTFLGDVVFALITVASKYGSRPWL